jgi:hypothetical protein
VLFSETCVWDVRARPEARAPEWINLGVKFRGETIGANSRPHDGEFVGPDGVARSAVPMAATMLASDGEPFLLLSVLSVWNAATSGRSEPEPAAWLARVMTHEMIHTLHLADIATFIENLAMREQLPKDLDDDIVESRFKDAAGYRTRFLEERDLFYEATLAEDAASARGLATAALSLATQRRARFFVDSTSVFRDLEDVFLTMEGLAEWFAFRAPGRPPEEERIAIASARENLRNSWSQAEGLPLFLLLERFDVPGWRSRVLGPAPVSPFQLLAAGLDRHDGSR